MEIVKGIQNGDKPDTGAEVVNQQDDWRLPVYLQLLYRT
jgi:hypothetical protein